jgi:lipoate synthase
MIRSRKTGIPVYQKALGRHVQEVLEKHAIEAAYKMIPAAGKTSSYGTNRKKNKVSLRLLGNYCTRADCAICDAKKSKNPPAPDPSEPKKIAAAVEDLNLDSITISSVHRDDIKDGGAAHFARCIKEIKKRRHWALVEALTHEFDGRRESVGKIVGAEPDIITHQIEDLRKTSRKDYSKDSMKLLKEIKKTGSGIPSRAQIFVGKGELWGDVLGAIRKIRKAGIDDLSITRICGRHSSDCPDSATMELYERSGYQAGFNRVNCFV